MSRKLLPLIIIIAGLAVLIGGVYGRWNFKARPTPRPGPTALVSLGDSVAAGDGLPVIAHSQEDTTCHRSDQAYPALLAIRLKLRLLQYACAGATVTNGIMGTQLVDGITVQPQIDAAATNISGNDVVLTIGANDVEWDRLLLTCAETDCTATLPDYQSNLDSLKSNLALTLQVIQDHHPHSLLLNTYYRLLSSGDTCYISYGITPAKIAFVNAREDALNTVITAVAEQYNVPAVTPDFSGHLLCDTHPWVQGPFDTAPLHPTQAGQTAIAAFDAEALR